MTLSFVKTHSSGSDYIVVNMADTSATDVAEMARRLCLPPLGVGADGLIVIKHLQRSQFAVRCFRPDGTRPPPNVRMLRCCARAIVIRYGYQSAILLSDNTAYEARVVGEDIGLRVPPRRDMPLRRVYRGYTGTESGARVVTLAPGLSVGAEGTWLYGTAVLLFEGEFPWP